MASSRNPARVKPAALRAGDTIGIVAPASAFNREDFETGCETLRRMGYVTVFSDSIFDRRLYFAGSPDRRVRELEGMFRRDDVKAILCARGGYGSNYLLPAIDIELIRAHPKIFVAYSDLTSLLTYFLDGTGLITFHGPMVAKDFAHTDGIDAHSWKSALEGIESWSFGGDSGLSPLRAGSAEGTLYGGCLSILTASLGTPYEIRTGDTILFMEDVATKPYQVDRMLMQLKMAGKFREVRGIVFGEMLDCVQVPGQKYTLEEVVMQVLGDVGVPVAYGLRSGHVSGKNVVLPLGARARLGAGSTEATLEVLENATIG